jgi:hypothetical protein
MTSVNSYLADQFGPKNGPSSSHPQYLIIGFDTEYQRETFTNDEGAVELKN